MPIGAAPSTLRRTPTLTLPRMRGREGVGVADEAAFAETAEFGAAPGTRWNYTNGNTMLLAHMIRDEAGGDAASV